MMAGVVREEDYRKGWIDGFMAGAFPSGFRLAPGVEIAAREWAIATYERMKLEHTPSD